LACLSRADLAVLGRYLYGPRWQSALAKELKVSRQAVVYWAGGQRPISEARTRRIAALARARHDKRVIVERLAYVEMAGSLTSMAAKAMLLAMITDEVQARLAAIATLTDEIERRITRLARIASDGVRADRAPSRKAAGDGLAAPTLPAMIAGSAKMVGEDVLSNDRKSVHDL
jgi:hypothetical protein